MKSVTPFTNPRPHDSPTDVPDTKSPSVPGSSVTSAAPALPAKPTPDLQTSDFVRPCESTNPPPESPSPALFLKRSSAIHPDSDAVHGRETRGVHAQAQFMDARVPPRHGEKSVRLRTPLSTSNARKALRVGRSFARAQKTPRPGFSNTPKALKRAARRSAEPAARTK
jgi:hypothetical protein